MLPPIAFSIPKKIENNIDPKKDDYQAITSINI